MPKIVSIRINLKLELLDDIKLIVTSDQQISFLKEKTGEEFILIPVPYLINNYFDNENVLGLGRICGQTTILTKLTNIKEGEKNE